MLSRTKVANDLTVQNINWLTQINVHLTDKQTYIIMFICLSARLTLI